MQRKDLALRVLSTAAIMSIVTSIAAPAFADIYYIGNGSIDVETITSTDGKQQYVKVTQGNKTYTDTSKEIVIKDGTSEKDATLKEATRSKDTQAKPAVTPAAGAATQELEAAGTADAAGPAAGESQPDPDAAFNLSEEEEDSEEGKDPTANPAANPTATPTENPTDNPTANPKKDVVYECAPADPEPKQPATKLAPTTAAAPTAKAKEVTLDDAPAATPTTPTAPAADPPAEGSADKPTKNVIRVVNDWVGKVLNIRLSNVNIKSDDTSRYADGRTDVLYDSFHGVSAAEVQGTGNTQIELDGQNVLDSSACQYWAGLSKKGSGNLTITDKTSDKGETITAKEEANTSGSLRAEGGTYGGAAIGGSCGQATDNITIEGYATVKANTLGYDAAGIGGGGSAKGSNITIQGHANVTADGGLSGAGIGGGSRIGNGCGGDAENITIQDYAKVTATGAEGAAIGSGSAYDNRNNKKSGDAKNIVIRGHATVNAKSSDEGAAIGAAGYSGSNDYSAEVTIGTKDATDEDVRITATGVYGSAIGNGGSDTKVTIQGHVTIQTASSNNYVAIGSKNGNVEVNIKDNVAIDTDPAVNIQADQGGSGIGGGERIYSDSGRTVKVNIDGKKNGKVKLGERSALTGYYGAISGTEVNIGDNVLLKMKQSYATYGKYINVKNAEAEVGTRSNTPGASGLVNSIGDNTELWYTDYYNQLQKIVHGKNVCKKKPGKKIGHEDATCGKDGYDKYQCDYEHDAKNPSCDLTWQEVLKATGNHLHTEIRDKKDATCTEKGYTGDTWCTDCNSEIAKGTETPVLGHNFHGTENVTKAATCTTEGVKLVKCTRCDVWETQIIPKDPNAHDYRDDWTVTTEPTCTQKGEKTRHCHNDPSHVERQEIPATGHQKTHIEGKKEPTCTEPGYTGDEVCDACGTVVKKGTVIPATGHHWKDNGDGTHTCPDCGATKGQPFNTNSALELRVVDAEGMDQPFTVSQNGTLRTYTGAYDTATLTGDLNTLRYLQEHGAQTIQFVTNGQTSSFAINDLLAQGSGSEVFYLTHRGAEEPTLLLVEADHSELVKD